MTTTDSEMMEDPVRPVIDDELVDRLMAQVDAEGLELLGPEGVLTELTSRILSRGLEVEMADHLGYEKGDPAGWGSGNNRNGSYPKTVQTRCRHGGRGDAPRSQRHVRTAADPETSAPSSGVQRAGHLSGGAGDDDP